MPFQVIDTIRNLTDADIALLKGYGVTGVSRYIARTSGIGKIMARPECDRIVASGLGLIVNYEQSAGDWRGGAVKGAADGLWARNYVRALGLPDSVCIIQSIDTSVLTAELGIAAAYQKAFNDAGGQGPQGCYGPRNVLEHLASQLLLRVAWEWMGTKGAPSSPVANIRQYRDKPYQLPFSYDVNTPITPYYGQYTGTGQAEDLDMTPAQDKILNTILQKVLTLPDDTWQHVLPAAENYGTDTSENRLNYAAVKTANTVLPTLADLEAKVDRLTAMVASLAVPGGDAQAVHDIVREELDATTWQSRPNT